MKRMNNLAKSIIPGVDGKWYCIDNGQIQEVVPISEEEYNKLSEEEQMSGKLFLLNPTEEVIKDVTSNT